MNILIYTQKSSYEGFSVGGAETSLRTLAEKLAASGHRVIYLTQTEWGRLPRYSIKEVNGVEVHSVGFVNLPSLGFGPLLRLRRRLADRRFDRIVHRLIRRHSIDLVHTYHEVPEMHRILNLRKRHNLDFVTVLRMGGKFWETRVRENPTLKGDYEEVFNGVECVNPNTPGLLELFLEAVRTEKMQIQLRDVFLGDIGLDLKRKPEPWSCPEEPPYRIMMASRFSTHQKRQELLLQALTLIPDKAIELYLVGDGPQRESLEHLSKELGIEEKVRFVPYMEQERLWELLSGCRLYTHACDFEGLSKIVIEAMAAGVPVLASDVVPLRDYIRDGETGFLVENSAQAWAGRISQLAGDSETLQTVSKGAMKYAEAHFDADRNVQVYIERFSGLKQVK